MTTRTRFQPMTGCIAVEHDAPADTRDPDTLFRRFYSYLYALSRNRIGYAAPTDPAIGVDDLCQEIAQTAFRSLKDYDPARGSVKTWLAQMARRTASNIRSSSTAIKRSRPTDPADEGADERLTSFPDPTCPEPSPAADFWLRVGRSLTVTERRVVEMRFREDRDLKEIGQACGFTASCACAVLKNALKKLHRERHEILTALGF